MQKEKLSQGGFRKEACGGNVGSRKLLHEGQHEKRRSCLEEGLQSPLEEAPLSNLQSIPTETQPADSHGAKAALQTYKDDQAKEFLKELKIRGGVSRNLVFTKTEHLKNKAEQERKEEKQEDEKGLSTKTKATTELNSNQDPSQTLLAKKANAAVCYATSAATGPNAKAILPLSSAFSPRNYLSRIGIQRNNRMLFQALNCSTKDCFVCSRKKGLRQLVTENLNKKYLTSRDSYNAKVVNDIICNENTHIVVVFKDYLIYDDASEFLKRSYAQYESLQRLPKLLDYYQKYSKVFPNYALMQGSKHMFKNIEWKQMAIDERCKHLWEMKKKPALGDSDVENKIFTTHFLVDLNQPDSILGRSQEDSLEESSWFKRTTETQMQSYIKSRASVRRQQKGDAKGQGECTSHHYEEMNLQELVDKFILKDSQSVSRCREDGKDPRTEQHKEEVKQMSQPGKGGLTQKPTAREAEQDKGRAKDPRGKCEKAKGKGKEKEKEKGRERDGERERERKEGKAKEAERAAEIDKDKEKGKEKERVKEEEEEEEEEDAGGEEGNKKRKGKEGGHEPEELQEKEGRGQCAILIKKAESKRKVLEIAIGSKKVVLPHMPVWDKIKERVKHERTKSHHNMSTQPNINVSLKQMVESNALFPLSCKHDPAAEAPGKGVVKIKPADAEFVRGIQSRNSNNIQQVTQAWTNAKPVQAAGRQSAKAKRIENKGPTQGLAPVPAQTRTQSGATATLANQHPGKGDVRSRSQGKSTAPRKESVPKAPQASARTTPKLRKESKSKEKVAANPRHEGKAPSTKSCAKSRPQSDHPAFMLASPRQDRFAKLSKAGPTKQSKPSLVAELREGLNRDMKEIQREMQVPFTTRAPGKDSAAGGTMPGLVAIGPGKPTSIPSNPNTCMTVKHLTSGGKHLRTATSPFQPETVGKPKVIAVDIEALGGEGTKPQQGIYTKTFNTTRQLRASGEYCNNRTPDPSHRRFKSSYLNNLNVKLSGCMLGGENEGQAEEPEAAQDRNRNRNRDNDQDPDQNHNKESPKDTQATPVGPQLASSKSVGNLRKKSITTKGTAIDDKKKMMVYPSAIVEAVVKAAKRHVPDLEVAARETTPAKGSVGVLSPRNKKL